MVQLSSAFVLSAVLVGSAVGLPQKQADVFATSSNDAAQQPQGQAPHPELAMSSGNPQTAKAAAELIGLNQPFDPFPIGMDMVMDVSAAFAQQIDGLGICSKSVDHGCVQGKMCMLGQDAACVELPESTKRITTEVFLGSLFKAGEVIGHAGKCKRGSQNCLSSGYCQIKASATGKPDAECGAMSQEEKAALLQDLIMQVYARDWQTAGQANYGFRNDDDIRANMADLMAGIGKCSRFDTADCQNYNTCTLTDDNKGCIPFTEDEKKLSEESAVQAIHMARTVGVCEPNSPGCESDGFCQLTNEQGKQSTACAVPHPARQYFLVQTIYSELVGDLFSRSQQDTATTSTKSSRTAHSEQPEQDDVEPDQASHTEEPDQDESTDTKQPKRVSKADEQPVKLDAADSADNADTKQPKV